MTQAIPAIGGLKMASEQDQNIEAAIRDNRKRLMGFIRQRIDDVNDAEDVLQDVFEELTLSYRLMQPVEKMASWLMRVARNKIIDRYRKKNPERLEDQVRFVGSNEEDHLFLADIISDPSSNGSSYD